MAELRIAGYVNDSIVDGPGLRFSLFTQGCPHHCKGCHNAETWDFAGGTIVDTGEILNLIKSNPLCQGVTFSGGDPFVQAKPLAELAVEIKKLGLELAIYTGWTFEQLLSMQRPEIMQLLQCTDVLIDGKFILEQRSLALDFKGSSNQRTIDVQKSLMYGFVVLDNSYRWNPSKDDFVTDIVITKRPACVTNY